jgi:hypothetical protein
MKSVKDCKALQVDTDARQQQCGKNSTELNIHKIKILFFTCETNSIHLKYFVKYILILLVEWKKDLVLC